MPLRLGALFAIALVVCATSAAADETKEHCVASYENAQKLRKAHDLVGARGELRVCADDACPDLARQDCVTWLREVDAAMPSILVSARTQSGSDVPSVRVLVDGAPIAATSGLPADVNPGAHTLRVEAAGFQPHTESIVVNESEKARLLHVVLEPVLATPPPPPPPQRVTHARPWPWPFVVGGFALASAAAGFTLWAVGVSKTNDDRLQCNNLCPLSVKENDQNMVLAGDVFVYVGIAAAISATVLFFVRPRAPVVSALAPLVNGWTF